MSDEINVAFGRGFQIQASVDKWKILTDQLVKDGGEDSAANPFQLFLASLATCAGYYALAFCNKRKINTHGLGLKMLYTWDKKERRITRMDFEIKLPEDFPEKYHTALIRAVDACTVKKHLTRPPDMKVYIKG
jgi:ribosomal protein S12 methylthiotransferase accessory factor